MKQPLDFQKERRPSSRQVKRSDDKPVASEHDYDNCKQRYCLMCFYIDLALHPELDTVQLNKKRGK